MAYGQNDHGYAYPTKGKTLLEIIQHNPEVTGYVEAEDATSIYINGGGVAKQTLKNIASGCENLTPNQVYWIKVNAKLLFGEYGAKYQRGGANPHVPSAVADIFHDMFCHIYEQ